MRKNEAGLTILETGDVVRIGGGKVLYRVALDELPTGFVNIESHNTGKAQVVARERLNLVTDVRTTEGWQEMNRTLGLEEAPVVETSAYAKAVLFALNKLQKHVYAGTVRKNVKAKRRGLNARQKASRKANR
jgi:hypothetical protein